MVEKDANNWNNGLYTACERGNLDIVTLSKDKDANCLTMVLSISQQMNHHNISEF